MRSGAVPKWFSNPGGGLGTRALAVAAALLVQLALLAALLNGLAATGTMRTTPPVTAAFDVPISPPVEPQPKPSTESNNKAGKAAPEAPRAKPREVSAPRPRIRVESQPAPPVSSKGTQNRSGAASSGEGTGGGGTGSGTGSGGSGNGAGAGAGVKAEKIAGDIRSTRDYPSAGRAQRLGRSVVIAVTVGADGRPMGCRIARPSGNAEADRITCELAMDRFRFRPAIDRAGNPIASTYGWEQRWFAP